MSSESEFESKSESPRRDVTAARSLPNRDWVCGYAELGHCCSQGPSPDGRCGRRAVEVVLVDGGTTDPVDPTADIDSEPGCIPRRSHHWRRHSLRVNLALLTGGLLLLCMTLSTREKIFVPGELSSKHAQILDNTLVSQRCGLCHPSTHGPAESTTSGSAILNALSLTARQLLQNDGRQDALCMQCHKTHLPAAALRAPHDLSPQMWRELNHENSVPAWQLVSVKSRLGGGEVNVGEGGSLARSTTEEGGSLARSTTGEAGSLARSTTGEGGSLARSTTGEEGSLARSTTGEEGSLARSTTGEVVQTSCAMCHQEHHGRSFDLQLISNRRCQACHRQQFESLVSGHPEFKNFPLSRPRSLAFSHARHADTHFPKKNSDFDCRACHVAEQGGGAYGEVTRSLTFENACARCHEQPIRAAIVDGWAVLQLPSLESGDVTSQSQLANWPAGARFGYDGVVSPVLRALLMADDAALPALTKLPMRGKIVDISTISDQRGQLARTLALATERLIDETARDGQVAWTRRLEQVTRRQLGREIDAHEKALIAAMSAGLPPDLFRQVQREWFMAGTPLAQAKTQGITVSQRKTIETLGDNQPAATDDSDNLLTSGLETAPAKPPASDAADDLLGGPTSASDPADLLLGASSEAPAEKKGQAVKGATHLTGGGWYMDPTMLAVRYMPTGHADPTLSAWSRWWSLIESQSVEPLINADARLAQRLATLSDTPDRNLSAMVPGDCTQCHQFGSGSIGGSTRNSAKLVSLASQFRVPVRPLTAREFTKFNHTPHLTLPAISDCRYCHTLDKSQPSTAEQHGSEFASMRLTQCVACHRPDGANAGCLQCHNYHVNVVGGK